MSYIYSYLRNIFEQREEGMELEQELFELENIDFDDDEFIDDAEEL